MRKTLVTLAAVLCFAVPCFAANSNTASGTYFLQHSNNKEFLKLLPNGVFILRQKNSPPNSEKPFVELSGKYQLKGENVKLILSNGGIGKGRLSGKVFTDNQGDKWVKETKYNHWWQRFRP